MTAVEGLAPAKVNLFLRVLAREESGFHQIETLFCAVGLADRVRVERRSAPGIELEVRGPVPCPPEENLATRAARLFLREAGGEWGVRIRLHKKIPAGAGLGGGSSDAAAVLRAVNHLAGAPLAPSRLARLGGELGADVPFFLGPSPLSLGWGRGDRLLSLSPLPAAPLLLALPSQGIDTARAYGALARGREDASWEGIGSGILAPEDLGSWAAVSGLAGNDFQEVVFRSRPELARTLGRLEATGPVLSGLSGTGSALFGVFSTPGGAEAARDSLEEEEPEVRFVLTRTLEGMPEASVQG